MATVDLACNYSLATSSNWSNGVYISANDGLEAAFLTGPAALVSLGVTTDAATAIPAGVTITDVRIVVKARTNGGAAGGVYLKTPGGFADGGAAGHTVVIGSGTGLYVSDNVLLERPAIATDPLTDLVFRLYHEGGTQSLLVDYITLRVVYELSANGTPILFLNENF